MPAKGKQFLPLITHPPCYSYSQDVLEMYVQLSVNKFCKFLKFVCLMVFNATFNTISVISWRSVLLVEETGRPVENH